MSRLCLPSRTIRDRIHALAPEVAEVSDALIWKTAAEPPDGLAEVEFWVPYLNVNALSRDELAARMPRLAVIQASSAGVERLLPLVPPGAALCDGRGVNGAATAEWALAAILAVLREFPGFVRDQAAQRWSQRYTSELADKRVLVIGAGDVGEQLGRRLQACDAVTTFVARTAREGVHSMADIAELLPGADVVVLAVPQTAETVGLVDAAFLAQLPDGALLVNAARGPVVDTDALLAELRSGRLHAALDVTDPEPLPAGHPLWTAPNLFLTPHVGGAVRGFAARSAVFLAEQLDRFLRGQPLHNTVTGEY